MQSEMGFPSSHQLKSYVASKSRLKLAAHTVLSADAGLLVPCSPSTNLRSLSHLQSLHLIVLSDSLTLLYPIFLLPSALPFEKFYFGAKDHLNHLTTHANY